MRKLSSFIVIFSLIVGSIAIQAANNKKIAAKEAKQLTEAGWTNSPGTLPLEKQLLRYYDFKDKDTAHKCFFATATAVGETYDAAKMQATALVKNEIVKQIGNAVEMKIEEGVSTGALTPEDATKIRINVEKKTSSLAGRISNIRILLECTRSVKKQKEVMLRIACDASPIVQELFTIE